MKTVSVFAGSQVKKDDPLYETAVGIGAGFARLGLTVMTGGYYGLMEAVSKGARKAGGHVIGVTADQIGIPYQLSPNEYNSEVVHFVDLRDRLHYMVQNADGYLALPGAAGTLHEIVETWELIRLGGIPRRPLVCYGSLWAQLIGMLDTSPYLGANYRGLISFVDSPEAALKHFTP